MIVRGTYLEASEKASKLFTSYHVRLVEEGVYEIGGGDKTTMVAYNKKYKKSREGHVRMR